MKTNVEPTLETLAQAFEPFWQDYVTGVAIVVVLVCLFAMLGHALKLCGKGKE